MTSAAPPGRGGRAALRTRIRDAGRHGVQLRPGTCPGMRSHTRPSTAPRRLGRRDVCAVASCHAAAASEVPMVLAGSRRGVTLCDRHADAMSDALVHA